MTGSWARDLTLDLDVIEAWNASAVVTLTESRELERLQVPNLGAEVIARHMEWYHLPIADRGIPDTEFETHWVEVGEALRTKLRSGFGVVVHCMGGLGRAGTIASRLLVELGWESDEAVAEVRRVRPGAIETTDQLDFVHGCKTIPERQPHVHRTAVCDRSIGALVGLAVGDALGTTLEFACRDGRERLTDIEGGGPFQLRPGEWTDDTSMALALADSLRACDGIDEDDLMRRFLRWWEEGAYSSTGQCFDIGMTVRSALARFKTDGNPIAGSTDPMSAGNGSLMRVSPIAIRYWNDRESLRDAAARQSRTTHAAPEAVDACIAFCELLADAIAGEPRTKVLRPRPGNWAGRINPILAGSWRGKPREEINSSGYVAHSLEAALWSIGRTGSFEAAVLLAANLGGDADTVAAITGQVAGALYGYSAIPRKWLDVLRHEQKLVAVAESLVPRQKSAGGRRDAT